MGRRVTQGTIGLVLGLFLAGCGEDTPTGSSDSNPVTQFDVQGNLVETFQETEIRVAVTEGGAPLRMQQGQMDVEHAGGHTRTVDMQMIGDSLTAGMMFFEPGEYRLRFRGMPMGQGMMMRDMGEYTLQVHRRHHVIGNYWVEFEVDPAPVLQNETATIRVFVFELLSDGTPGDAAAGLDVGMAIYDPADAEATLTVTETSAGVYEAEYSFGAAGMYELYVQIGSAPSQIGEFHIPVLTDQNDEGLGYEHHQGGWWHHGGHDGVIGDYWVDLDLDQVPVPENQSATIRLNIFQLAQDGTQGEPAVGLDLAMTIHDPAGVEASLVVTESAPGVYEAEHAFGEAGLYELHVEIGSVDSVTGELYIPVGSWEDGDHDRGRHGGHGRHGGGMGGRW
jgi:hypothetical protein